MSESPEPPPPKLDYASPEAEHDDFWGVRDLQPQHKFEWSWTNFVAGLAAGTVTQAIAYAIIASFYTGKTTNPIRDGLLILVGFLFFDVMLKLLVVAIVSSRMSNRASFRTGLVVSFITLFGGCVLFSSAR